MDVMSNGPTGPVARVGLTLPCYAIELHDSCSVLQIGFWPRWRSEHRIAQIVHTSLDSFMRRNAQARIARERIGPHSGARISDNRFIVASTG
jgi:hypothetical protein